MENLFWDWSGSPKFLALTAARCTTAVSLYGNWGSKKSQTTQTTVTLNCTAVIGDNSTCNQLVPCSVYIGTSGYYVVCVPMVIRNVECGEAVKGQYL